MTACAILLGPRAVIEAAAEFDPDTYVPILDALDEGDADLEDDEREPNCDEDQSSSETVDVFEHCPHCGSLTNCEGWDIA